MILWLVLWCRWRVLRRIWWLVLPVVCGLVRLPEVVLWQLVVRVRVGGFGITVGMLRVRGFILFGRGWGTRSWRCWMRRRAGLI